MSFTKFRLPGGNCFYEKRDTILSVAVLFIASFTYLSTMEPTASFWDCGEFINSSYKLEVGHPPGNPVFQLIARFFTLFGDKEHAALLVNAMSALCSAFTIYFMYLSILLLAGKIRFADREEKEDGTGKQLSGARTINGILASGAALLGSLAYCFTDTFWFSAVEGEVYAMSSLFTAVVFWAMLKWDREAESPYANRWILLIAFLMGLSIGVHLLNLLTIPALVFIYYFRKYPVTPAGCVKALLVSGGILATILYGIIPYLPQLAAYTDLLFVNGLGLPVNSGTVLFILLILTGAVAGIRYTYKRGRKGLNTVLLCFLMIVIGYSAFSVTVIRASADTPTNEYQPDNPFTLVRYLAREQYGTKPLLYGETFASRAKDVEIPEYYNYYDGKYIKIPGPADYIFDPRDNMLFPRMWSSGSDSYMAVYKTYTRNRAPSFGDNLRFFWDYQVDFMYIRYFMWNFAGRQNDLHAPLPDKLKGNWESGIGFLDKLRLGDNTGGPDYISASRGKNHYYFLPLLLGLAGMFFQLKREKRGWTVVMLLFLLTGLAIVVYLNQTPLQVRERDYAYAGSFYAFCIWIGFAVFPVAGWLRKLSGKLQGKAGASLAVALLLPVPLLMAVENRDDHDRSDRYTLREMAYNMLAPLDPEAILVTHSDNDTFPLWYLQGVEGVRTDVRIMNTSLLGMDWYINQMRRKTYESDPVKLSLDKSQYYYGVNDGVLVNERITQPVSAREVIDVFKNPRITVQSPFMRDKGKMVNYIAARKIVIPVNKENVIKNKIVPACDYDKIADSVVLTIPGDKIYLRKDELILLDMLSCYEWDRPLYFAGTGEINIGIKEWLQYEGLVYRFVPVKSDTGVYEMNADQIDLEKVYQTVKNSYRWKSLGDTTIHIDYQNLITFSSMLPPRQVMVTAAEAFFREWEDARDDGREIYRKRGIEMLDGAFALIPSRNIPLSTLALDSRNDINTCRAVQLYLAFGEREKGNRLADAYFAQVMRHASLETLREPAAGYVYTLAEICRSAGEEEAAHRYLESFEKAIVR